MCKTTQRDLTLPENQLPKFVLEELHSRVFLGDNSTRENCVKFIDLAFNYFEDYYPHKSSKKVEMINNFKSCRKHFTYLIRFTILPKKIQVKGVNVSMNTNENLSQHFTPCSVECVLRTATKLNGAGVTFEKVEGKSYLDIKFDKVPILSYSCVLVAYHSPHVSKIVCKYLI